MIFSVVWNVSAYVPACLITLVVRYHWFIRVVATVEDMNRRNSVLVVRSSLLAKWLWERIRLGLGLGLYIRAINFTVI